MNFTLTSTALSSRLQAIGRVISSKNNIPALECFLFEIENNTLRLTASDGETTLTTTLELINSSENSRFAINAKTIQDAMKEIPEQPLTFDINTNTMEIVVMYQNGKYSIIGQNADEYPTTMTLEESASSMTIQSDILLSSINRAIFATAEDDLRPVMTGLYFDLTTENLAIVASDGHKLVYSKSLTTQGNSNASFILRKKPATLLKNLLGKEHHTVTIRFNERNAEFLMEGSRMVCRLIEGKYPNYNSVIPQDNPNCVTVDRGVMLSALRRVTIFSNPTSTLVKLNMNTNQMTISSQDIDFSMSAEETLVCDYTGIPMSIGFKGTFLVDILNNLSSENVIIKLADPSRAGVIVPAEQPENENILMLLMPMMLSD